MSAEIRTSQSARAVRRPRPVSMLDSPGSWSAGSNWLLRQQAQLSLSSLSLASTASSSSLQTSRASRGSAKRDREPRPDEMRITLSSLLTGLRDCNSVTCDTIGTLQNQQHDHTNRALLLSAERDLNSLASLDSEVLDLQHEYNYFQDMYTGSNDTRNLSPKQCARRMCELERQAEALMGTVHCRVKELAGFARLAPGDVYHVTVSHAAQKWRMTCNVHKDSRQTWSNAIYRLKLFLGEPIIVKVEESRVLGRIKLGTHRFDPLTLMTSSPHLISFNVTPTATLKLRLVMQWRALEEYHQPVELFDLSLDSTPIITSNRNRDVYLLPDGSELSARRRRRGTKSVRHRYSCIPSLSTDGLIDNGLAGPPTASLPSFQFPSTPDHLMVDDSTNHDTTYRLNDLQSSNSTRSDTAHTPEQLSHSQPHQPATNGCGRQHVQRVLEAFDFLLAEDDTDDSINVHCTHRNSPSSIATTYTESTLI